MLIQEKVTQSKALKRIGLIAKELKLPIYVIRLWEKKIDILKPIRKPKGTRYYTSSQTEILKEVKYLLQKKKYTIEAVNLYFKEKKRLNYSSEKRIMIKEIEALIKQDLI